MRRQSVLGTISLSLLTVLFAACGKPSTLYYEAGVKYMENREYAQAEENFRLSLDQEAKTKDCLRLYGVALMTQGKNDEAIDALTEALHMNNGKITEADFDINHYLGLAYENVGNYERAREIYSALIAVRPKETDTYYRRAVCNLMLGDITAADSDFSVVTNKDPNNCDLYLKIFFAIRDAGLETDANSYLRALLVSDRKISDYDRGRINYYLGDYSNARIFLEKAKSLTDPDTFLMLGKTYEAIEDYNYAGTLYQEYLNAKGNNAAVYNQLGVCRSLAGDYSGALNAFTFGLQLNDPDWNRQLLFNEAVTYENLLDFNTAYEKMSDYVSKYPQDSDAAHELIFLETRRSEVPETPED